VLRIRRNIVTLLEMLLSVMFIIVFMTMITLLSS
jgi:hypothetical protein